MYTSTSYNYAYKYFSCTQVLLIIMHTSIFHKHMYFSRTQILLMHIFLMYSSLSQAHKYFSCIEEILPQQVLCWLRPISIVRTGPGVRPGMGPGLLQDYNLLVPPCVQKGGNFTHQPVYTCSMCMTRCLVTHPIILRPALCSHLVFVTQSLASSKKTCPYLRNFVITIPVHPRYATVSHSLSPVLSSDDHRRPSLHARQFGPHQTPTLHCGLQHLQATSITEPDRGRPHTAVCTPRPPGSATHSMHSVNHQCPRKGLDKDWIVHLECLSFLLQALCIHHLLRKHTG